jgi:hypothetical protein
MELSSNADPGARLIVTFRYSLAAECKSQIDYYESVRDSGLVLEFPHAADPMPGDPIAGQTWLGRKEFVSIVCDGARQTFAIGMILRKPLSIVDLAHWQYTFNPGQPPKSMHFPEPGTGNTPIPVALKRSRDFTLADIVDAYSVDLTGAIEIANNLILSGVIRVSKL